MKYSGSSANVQWRAIAVDHLRLHPLFVPLPCADLMLETASLDVTKFRQHSPQWNALHAGRITTSVLASILGFYENDIAKRLAIPNSLRDHARAVEGWQQLRTKPHLEASALRSFSTTPRERASLPQADALWTQGTDHFPFHYQPSEPPHNIFPSIENPFQAKLCWGNAQEPTAVLCAINYLAATAPELRVHESGMATFEKVLADPDNCGELERAIQRLQDSLRLPALGASPDGLIVSPTGQVTSVLEVKCVSPFIANHIAPYGMRVASSTHFSQGFPAWHIPQLQLEMLCCGASCRSALVVLLEFNRARIFRIDRDDQYIWTMLLWASEFYTRYIASVPSNVMKPPPPQFFTSRSSTMDGSQTITYAHFVQRTQLLASNAKLLALLGDDQVQRSSLNAEFFLDEA